MNINDIKIDKFICGEKENPAQASLAKMLEGENFGAPRTSPLFPLYGR